MDQDRTLQKYPAKYNDQKPLGQKIELPQHLMGNQAMLQRISRMPEVLQRDRQDSSYLPKFKTGVNLKRHHIIPIGIMEGFLNTLWENKDQEEFVNAYEEVNTATARRYSAELSKKGSPVGIFDEEDRGEKKIGFAKEKKRVYKALDNTEKQLKQVETEYEKAMTEYQYAQKEYHEFHKELFCWLPGNLTAGPDRGVDDPKDKFDEKSAQIHAVHENPLLMVAPPQLKLLCQQINTFNAGEEKQTIARLNTIMGLLRPILKGNLIDGSKDDWSPTAPAHVSGVKTGHMEHPSETSKQKRVQRRLDVVAEMRDLQQDYDEGQDEEEDEEDEEDDNYRWSKRC